MTTQLVKLLLGSLLLFFTSYNSTAITSDTVSLHGKVVLVSGTLPSTEVTLNPYNESDESYNTYLSSDGSFEFKVPISDATLYEVRYGGYSKSVLFTKAEISIGFTIYINDGKPSQMFISNSFENVAYEFFRKYHVGFRDTLKGFRPACINNKENCALYYGMIAMEHNRNLEQLIKNYPQTFTAKVLVPMSKSPTINSKQSPLEQMERHYFDGANFTDTELFNTPDIATKFVGYLDYLADTTKNARLLFINDMFLKTMGNDAARRRIGLALYNLFAKTYRENYLQSLEEFLDKQDWVLEQLPVVMAQLKLASKVLPGSKAPEVFGVDLNGKTKLLSETIKNSKITMLLFWSSDCMHCIESMPDLVRLYEKYHPQGLNIYAASLDSDKMQWKKYLSVQKNTWTNVHLPESSATYNEYFIQATPSIALIDKNGLIIHRFMDVKGLEGLIAKYIK